MKLAQIKAAIMADETNLFASDRGWEPLYCANVRSRVAIIGQAPGRIAQESNIAWNDQSGKALRAWLGVSDEQFYNPSLFAILPMDFYFPGYDPKQSQKSDLPPRKEFAQKWHNLILDQLPDIELILLIGQYAQNHYLGKTKAKNLTETVRAYDAYLPRHFPLVHPSPRNYRWHAKNPWFKKNVIPVLQSQIARILPAD